MKTTPENAHRYWLSDEEHRERGGTQCPSCGDTDIAGGHVDIDAGRAAQMMLCAACGAEWTDIYKLTGFI